MHGRQALSAEEEAQKITLGPDAATITEVRKLIRERIEMEKPWALIGGPPCQAYSLVGRARNSNRDDYDPETDHRQTLYVEYLQILADHAPPVFVMENVKGLLSARLQEQPLFRRILDDLRNPRRALARGGRRAIGPTAEYEIHSVVTAEPPSAARPSDFVVRSELFGVPQRRHRVILIGIRSDIKRPWQPIAQEGQITVRERLDDLPRLRSGLSTAKDSYALWSDNLLSFLDRRWFKKSVDGATQRSIRHAVAAATMTKLDRGANFRVDNSGNELLNHSTRGHMPKDLARYMFVSAFGAVNERSPELADFPADLLPAHANVDRALAGNLFADRFRVQLADAPSTTVTSHIAKDGHYFIHHDPSQCRSLTVREAARLQTFPDDYFFCGPRTAQYEQVGNAVPPALARRIAEAVAPLF